MRQRFDCIADTVGGETARRFLPTLKAGGVLATVSTNRVEPIEGLDVQIRLYACRPDAKRLQRLAADIAAGAFGLSALTILPMSQAPEAHRRMEAGGAGKIILVPDGIMGMVG